MSKLQRWQLSQSRKSSEGTKLSDGLLRASNFRPDSGPFCLKVDITACNFGDNEFTRRFTCNCNTKLSIAIGTKVENAF